MRRINSSERHLTYVIFNIYLSIGMLLINNNCFSQDKERIIWSTDSESLPQNSIKSITADKYGFLWMTTENGLVRFDGRDFKIFDSQNTGIRNNRATHFMGSAKSDSLYTSTENNEDIIFIHQRQAVKIKTGKYKNFWMEEPGKKNLFVSEGIPNYFFGLPKRPYKILLPDGDRFYIENDSVSHFDRKDKLQYKIKFRYNANKYFFVLGQNLVYLEPDGNYAIINNGKVTRHKLTMQPGDDFQVYWNIVSEQVFVYTNQNLYQLGCIDNKVIEKLLIENENLKSANLWSVHFDVSNGTIYLGSTKRGLGVYKIKSFHTITTNKNQHPELFEVFYAVHPYNDSITVSSSGIFMDNSKILRNLNFGTDKYVITIDRNGDIWTNYFSLLHRYKKSDGFKKQEEWDLIDDISTIYAAKNGTIWMDVSKRRKNKGALYHFQPDEKPKFIKQADFNTKINYITEDANGKLWLGTKNGLFYIDPISGKSVQVAGTENLKIRSIYIDKDQYVWLTTYEKGVFLYRDNKLHAFPKDKNGYLTTAHCILEDQKGFFWISTNKGLFQVKRKSLLEFAASKLNTLYYQYYDKGFGFLTNEFNGGCQPCAAKLSNGRFHFPSLNGIVSFNPESITPILPNKEIFIDEILVDGKKIHGENSIELDRNFERVTFVITSSYFGHPSNLNFEAKLEGPDGERWMEVPKDRSISFTTLHPGTYTLTIRKLNGFDSGYDFRKITIIIPHAYWQTAWFRLLMAVIILILIYTVYHFRVKFIRKRNIQLEKTINDQTYDLKNTISTLRTTKENLHEQIDRTAKLMQYITHDIKTPLKFMAMASQMMYESENESPEELRENLKAIFISSTQMYNFIDNLLEYSKAYNNNGLGTEEFSLHKVIEDKIALFESVAQSQKTTIKNLVLRDASLATNRQLFSIIIHNILDNAVKYTVNGSIIISAVSNVDKVEITVRDTGVGMTEKNKSHYTAVMENYENSQKKHAKLGLYIVIELLLILNGTIEFTSRENKGTTVRISFKKG